MGEASPEALEDAMDCLISGEIHSKWEHCLMGSLTEEEMKVSSYLTQMWTNFAVNGKPGLGAVPWNSTHQKYMKITDELQIFSDYRQEYHIAADQAYNRTGDTTTTTTENSDSGSQKITISSLLIILIIFSSLH